MPGAEAWSSPCSMSWGSGGERLTSSARAEPVAAEEIRQTPLALCQPMRNPPAQQPAGGWLALDGPFWRRVAHLGASRAPGWFVRWSPPLIGVAIAIAVPKLRRTIARQ